MFHNRKNYFTHKIDTTIQTTRMGMQSKNNVKGIINAAKYIHQIITEI